MQMGIRLHTLYSIAKYEQVMSESLISTGPYQKLVQQETRTWKTDLEGTLMEVIGKTAEVSTEH